MLSTEQRTFFVSKLNGAQKSEALSYSSEDKNDLMILSHASKTMPKKEFIRNLYPAVQRYRLADHFYKADSINELLNDLPEELR